jgi:DNA-binding beta-propeller fold protein YncE
VAVAATADAVWAVDGELDEVALVDPATDEVVDRVDVGNEPVAVAASDTDVWVVNAGDGTLTHIDPSAFG